MDDIIIGKDIPTVTTISIYPISNKLSISANPNVYRVNLRYLEINLKIDKKHSVGKKLAKLFEKNTKWYDVQDYLIKVALSKISIEHLKTLIDNKTRNAYEDGQAAKQKEFRNVLGIR